MDIYEYLKNKRKVLSKELHKIHSEFVVAVLQSRIRLIDEMIEEIKGLNIK